MVRILPISIVLAVVSFRSTTTKAQLSTPDSKWTLTEEAAWNRKAKPLTDDEVIAYVKNAPAPELAVTKRLPYYVRHLNSKNKTISRDAASEVWLAGVRHIRNLSASDLDQLKAYIEHLPDKKEFRIGLDHAITGYLLARGSRGLDEIDSVLFKNKKRPFGDVYSGMLALRFLWKQQSSPIKKQRLMQSMRLLLDNGALADLAINDLARWQDWSIQDRLMKLNDTLGNNDKMTHRAIIAFMIRSTQTVPKDQVNNLPQHVIKGRQYAAELKRKSPKDYKRVETFFVPVFKAKTSSKPKKGRTDARGDFEAVATRLSGFNVDSKAIHNIVFALDGKSLYSGSGDGFVYRWNVSKVKPIRKFKVHSTWCFSIALHPNQPLIATGGGDQLIQLWKPNAKQAFKTLKGHADDVHAVAFDHTGARIFSAGDDMHLVIHDVETSRILRRLKGHTAQIPCLAVSPDGSLIATGSRDDTIRIWDADSGAARFVLKGHSNDVHSVAVSPNGKMLASVSYDETVKLWDVEQGRLLKTLKGHVNWVFTVAFHPEGQLLASGDKDGRILLWDVNTGQELAAIKRQRHVSCVAFSPDGKVLASSSPAATICLWDVATRKLIKTMKEDPPKPRTN